MNWRNPYITFCGWTRWWDWAVLCSYDTFPKKSMHDLISGIRGFLIAYKNSTEAVAVAFLDLCDCSTEYWGDVPHCAALRNPSDCCTYVYRKTTDCCTYVSGGLTPSIVRVRCAMFCHTSKACVGFKTRRNLISFIWKT